VRVATGGLTKASVNAQVDSRERRHTVKNHTATDLLHQALKDTLGTHVNKTGSSVGPDRLRFDFSHFGQVSSEELEKIERIVNEKVWEGISVQTGYHNLQEVKDMGAMAVFGEKYGDVVRVVEIGGYSLELCGGVHVTNTAEIGVFKIVSQSGIGAGIRRIEAVTGKGAYENLKESENLLEETAALMKSSTKDLIQKVQSFQQEMKNLQRENESLMAKISYAVFCVKKKNTRQVH